MYTWQIGLLLVFLWPNYIKSSLPPSDSSWCYLRYYVVCAWLLWLNIFCMQNYCFTYFLQDKTYQILLFTAIAQKCLWHVSVYWSTCRVLYTHHSFWYNYQTIQFTPTKSWMLILITLKFQIKNFPDVKYFWYKFKTIFLYSCTPNLFLV